MKQKIQYVIVAGLMLLGASACNSSKTGEQVSDSLEEVTDSVRNDTSGYDISSQRDSSSDSASHGDTTAH